MAFSSYLENKLLLHTFAATSYTGPSTCYLALTVSGTEVSGGSYARKSCAFSVTDNEATNSADVTFTTATADWGTIDGIKVYDALTTGNELASGTLTTAKTIASGDTAKVTAGDITITLT